MNLKIHFCSWNTFVCKCIWTIYRTRKETKLCQLKIVLLLYLSYRQLTSVLIENMKREPPDRLQILFASRYVLLHKYVYLLFARVQCKYVAVWHKCALECIVVFLYNKCTSISKYILYDIYWDIFKIACFITWKARSLTSPGLELPIRIFCDIKLCLSWMWDQKLFL